MRALFSVLLLVACVGCHESGTWKDDPKNWQRAFDEPKPPEGFSIVHSWYMRTPHFTAEYAWFFELQLTEAVKSELVKSSDLNPVQDITDENFEFRVYANPPDWFKPEPLSDYDVYESKSQRDFLLLFEKKGTRAYLTRRQ